MLYKGDTEIDSRHRSVAEASYRQSDRFGARNVQLKATLSREEQSDRCKSALDSR
jgi:hypothetical protein